MNLPEKPKLQQRLRKQALGKMLKLDPKQRQRLARLELLRRNVDPNPPKG